MVCMIIMSFKSLIFVSAISIHDGIQMIAQGKRASGDVGKLMIARILVIFCVFSIGLEMTALRGEFC